MTAWRILVRSLSEPDSLEIVNLVSSDARVWIEPAAGVVVETNPTGFGDFRDQRIIPWSRLADFRRWERDGDLFLAESAAEQGVGSRP